MSKEPNTIMRIFGFTFWSVWVAKWHHFIKRSVWRYLLTALLVAFSWVVVKKLSFASQEALYALVYFGIGFLVFGFLVNLIAVALQAKRLKNRTVKANFGNLKVQLVFFRIRSGDQTGGLCLE